MRSAPRRCLSTIGVALALLASSAVRAACPDAANNIPGCQLDSSADFDAFHFQDFDGFSSFDGSVGHAGPGSLAMAETTGDFVAIRGECLTPSYPATYHFGAYLVVSCSKSDGGIVHVDDALAGTLIFFDTFESNTTDTRSVVFP